MPELETMQFIGSQGVPLAGVVTRPDGPVKCSVLMAHCFTCTKDLQTLTRLASGLAEAGYLSMRFDFTGLGESGGDFSTKTVSGNVADIVRAGTTMIEQNIGPRALIGHSLGGAAVILAEAKLKKIESVITIGAPSDVTHVRHLMTSDTCVEIGARSFDVLPSFIVDLENHRVLDTIAAMDSAYLAVHSKDDDVVGYEHAVHLTEAHQKGASGSPTQLTTLESGGHLLGPRAASDQALEAIVSWLDQTL